MTQFESLVILAFWAIGTFVVWWRLDSWAERKRDDDEW